MILSLLACLAPEAVPTPSPFIIPGRQKIMGYYEGPGILAIGECDHPIEVLFDHEWPYFVSSGEVVSVRAFVPKNTGDGLYSCRVYMPYNVDSWTIIVQRKGE